MHIEKSSPLIAILIVIYLVTNVTTVAASSAKYKKYNIQGFIFGMNSDEAKTALLKNGFKEIKVKGPGKYKYIKNTPNGGKRELFLTGIYHIYSLRYIQQFPSSVNINAKAIEQKMISKYGTPASIRSRKKTVVYDYYLAKRRVHNKMSIALPNNDYRFLTIKATANDLRKKEFKAGRQRAKFIREQKNGH